MDEPMGPWMNFICIPYEQVRVDGPMGSESEFYYIFFMNKYKDETNESWIKFYLHKYNLLDQWGPRMNFITFLWISELDGPNEVLGLTLFAMNIYAWINVVNESILFAFFLRIKE